ncbi:MAG: M20 family metallopeptidase [Isosphaeraceae bacterium]
MNEQMVRDLSEDIKSRQPAMLALLEAVVRAESPSVVPESQDGVQALLAGSLRDDGFRVRMIGGRGQSGGLLQASPRVRTRRVPYQLLIGHTDTVWPLGTLSRMPLEIEGGKLAGPGAFDMKGGLVQLVFALKSLRSLGVELSVTPVVVLNSDEEIGSIESSPWIRRFARRADRCFVLEPALGPAGKLKTARKGAGQFEIRIEGRSAHAGLDPTAGASAILELSYVIQTLEGLNDPVAGISVNVGQIDGGLRPNVVAPSSKAVVDVRVPTRAEGQRIEAEIHALRPTVPGTRIVVEGTMDVPPMEPTQRNRRLWEAAREAGLRLGLELAEGVAGGVSDGNTTSQYTATLDGLGAVGDGAHATFEFLDCRKLIERCTLLALLLTLPPLRCTTGPAEVVGADAPPPQIDVRSLAASS